MSDKEQAQYIARMYPTDSTSTQDIESAVLRGMIWKEDQIMRILQDIRSRYQDKSARDMAEGIIMEVGVKLRSYRV